MLSSRPAVSPLPKSGAFGEGPGSDERAPFIQLDWTGSFVPMPLCWGWGDSSSLLN